MSDRERASGRSRDPASRREGFRAAWALEAAEALVSWYARARRPFPWRQDPTPYRVWVSEAMLQQTRVETVARRFESFLARFPSLEALAKAPLEEVLAEWSGLGYYRRARSLHEGARKVVEEHGGEFPRDFEAALRLPGIGPYTAAAILAIAYDIPVPVVDGNVERILCRTLRLAGNPRSGPVRAAIAAALEAVLSRVRPSEFAEALMELGQLVCTPRDPDCAACPLEPFCEARRRGDVSAYPELPARRAAEIVELEALVFEDAGRLYVERRPEGEILAGLWMFPLEEAPRGGGRGLSTEFLRRVERRAGRKAEAVEPAGVVRHSVTFRRLRVRVFRARAAGPRARSSARGRWVAPEELGTSVPVPSLALKIAGSVQVLPPKEENAEGRFLSAPAPHPKAMGRAESLVRRFDKGPRPLDNQGA